MNAIDGCLQSHTCSQCIVITSQSIRVGFSTAETLLEVSSRACLYSNLFRVQLSAALIHQLMNGDILSSNQGCWILISHQGANVLTLVYTEIPNTSQSGQRWSLVHAS